MGVAQKTMFSISDCSAKFFGKSGAPMEHNTTAKSKQTFFLEIRPFWHNRPRAKLDVKFKKVYAEIDKFRQDRSDLYFFYFH